MDDTVKLHQEVDHLIKENKMLRDMLSKSDISSTGMIIDDFQCDVNKCQQKLVKNLSAYRASADEQEQLRQLIEYLQSAINELKKFMLEG